MKNINLYRVNNPLNHNYIKNNSTPKRTTENKSVNFEDTLDEIQSKNIKFSKHALDRMNKRNLNLTKDDMAKLEDAIEKVEKKGVKEALIVMNNQSFIASIKSRTIITAVSNDKLGENIFTNIDGAVII